MALSLATKLNTISVPAAYLRVRAVNLDADGQSTVIVLDRYASKDDRDAEKADDLAPGTNRFDQVVTAITPDEFDSAFKAAPEAATLRDASITAAYTVLEGRDEYAGATTV